MKKTSSLRIAALCCTLIILPFANSPAADKTWDGGGANNTWNTASNWVGDTVPVANDVLIFAGSTRLTNSNNLTANTQFDGINFAADAGAFTLGGSPAINLGGGITNSSANLQTFSMSGGYVVISNISIDTGSAGILFSPTAGAKFSSSGGTNITKVGTGTLFLSQNNDTIKGSFIIAEGVVEVTAASTAASPLGQGGTGTYMSNNTKFLIARTTAGSVSPNGTLYVADNAQVTLGVTTATVTNTLGEYGYTAGYGQGVTIIKEGDGILKLNQTTAGLTNWGITTANKWLVKGGFLQANSDASLGNSNNVIALDGGGLQLITTLNNTARTIQLSNNAANSINNTNAASAYSVSAKITGTGGFTKTGAGTVTLAASNDYTGKTTIAEGTLQLSNTGSFASSSEINLGTSGSQGTLLLTNKASFTFGSSQTVSGYGAINIGAGKTVTVSGTLAPGNSAGIITNTGNLTLDSTATIVMELGAGAAGIGYDQLQVSGALTYDGALTINGLGGYDITTQTNYTLFTFGSYGGNFDSVSVGGFGLTYDNASAWVGTNNNTIYTYTLSSGVLDAAAVPEPSTYALLGLAGVALAAYRLRRRKR